MGKIVLDSAIAATLRKCGESTMLCDSEGNVIGFFQPPPRIYEPGEMPVFDEEELARRERRWCGIPSAEARRMLEELR